MTCLVLFRFGLGLIFWMGAVSAETSAFAADMQKFPFLAEVVSDNVNIRSGQSMNFETLIKLNKGDKVVVVDRDYSWLKIKLPVRAESWVSAKYINMLDEEIGEITADHLNIRAGKGTRFSVLGQLAKGELVRSVSKEGEWLRIEPVDKSYGWVLEEFVKFDSNDVPSPRVVARPTKNIYVKKRQLEQKAEREAREEAAEISDLGIPVFSGVLEDLGDQAVSKDIRHRIVVDKGHVYYLKGYRRIIDTFLHNKVEITGIAQPDVTAQYPVILVTKISLVM